MTTLGQRWLKVVSSVGPTLDANVGPTSLCSSGERSANILGKRWPNVGPTSLCSSDERSVNMLSQRWPNVASFFPTMFCQHYANIYGLWSGFRLNDGTILNLTYE